MKRMKGKKCFKYFCISSGVLIGVLAFFTVSALFIFGEEAIEAADSFIDNIGSDDEVPYDGDIPEGALPWNTTGGGGGGAAGGGGGSSGGDSGFVCSEWEQVQYSLGNFDENIECLVYGIGTCNRVKMTCRAEVVNLDRSLGGVFGIRFSLYSGNGNPELPGPSGDELVYEVVSENIEARGRVNMVSEIELDGEFDVEDLRCVVLNEAIPLRCVA